MKISLYPHQSKAVDKLRSGSILCGGVGSGKSRTAIAYYFCHECSGKIESDGTLTAMIHPKDLYIITTAHKRDTLEWEYELLPFGLSTKRDLNWNSVSVHVDSWNNISKYTGIQGCFFIFDEQRVVGSGSWVKSFLKISKLNNWILLSATPGDVWMDYAPVFIANGFYKNKTEFIKRHVIYNRFSKYPKIDRYINEERLEKLRSQVLVTMPVKKKTTRHVVDIFTNYDKNELELIDKCRWDPYLKKPIKTSSEVCYVMRKSVNLDPSRTEEVGKILKLNKKVIIFYNFDYELIELRIFLEKQSLEWAEWNGHRHESIPESDQWVYLVQYTAGAEGWNCIATNVVIFYSLNYSYKTMEQASGRIDRLNTPYFDLYYYRLRSKSSIDNGIFKAITNKKTFNESAFVDKKHSR
jgi:hypothetical protein